MKIIRTEEQWLEVQSKELVFVKSGISAIDGMVGGFLKEEVTVIAGASGNGKSFVSFSSAVSMANMGYKVLYFSLENSDVVDANRRVSIMNQYGFSSTDGLVFVSATGSEDGVSYEDIKALVMGDEKFDVVFIDSIDFIETGEIGDGFSSFKALNELCRKLRFLASESGSAFVVMSQLNRDSVNKSIVDLNMGNIQGSLGIIQKASHVWVVQHKDKWFINNIKSRTEMRFIDGCSACKMQDGKSGRLDIRISE